MCHDPASRGRARRRRPGRSPARRSGGRGRPPGSAPAPPARAPHRGRLRPDRGRRRRLRRRLLAGRPDPARGGAAGGGLRRAGLRAGRLVGAAHAPGPVRRGARAVRLLPPPAGRLRGRVRGRPPGDQPPPLPRPGPRPGRRRPGGGPAVPAALPGPASRPGPLPDAMAGRGAGGHRRRPAGAGHRPGRGQRADGLPPRPPPGRRRRRPAGPGRPGGAAAPTGAGRLVPGRPGRPLQALHPRRLPGGAVRAGLQPPVLPLPPVGVRPAGRGPADLRAGRPAAAPAADRDHPRGVRAGQRRLRGPGRPRLLEPAVMIVRRGARWLDDRLGAASVARTSLAKVFPDHWSFMLGEIALYCFVALVLTGVFLTFFFEPGTNEVVYHGGYAPLDGARVSAAYVSSVRLSFDVRTGLLMRQVHHWAALVFLAAIVVHMCRIFFTGAFRRPRELNWLIGVTLLALSLFNGFSGYSLPDDLLSGVGLRIAYSIALSVPVVGSWLAFLVFGGEFPADQIIHRLFVVHILLVPGLLVGLLTAHIGILVRQKHSQFPGPGRTEHNVVGSKLWPTYATRSVDLFCAILAVLFVLGGLVQINPIWLYGPFEPSQVSSPAQPDWYIGWVEGALRMYPPWEFRLFGRLVPNPFLPAVLVPAATFGLLYLWPFLEQRLTRDREAHQLLDRPRDHPVRCAAGAGTLAFYGLLLATASNDVIARLTRAPVASLTWAGRVVLLAGPPVVAVATDVVVRALRDSGAEGVLQISAGQLAAAARATVRRCRSSRCGRSRTCCGAGATWSRRGTARPSPSGATRTTPAARLRLTRPPPPTRTCSSARRPAPAPPGGAAPAAGCCWSPWSPWRCWCSGRAAAGAEGAGYSGRLGRTTTRRPPQCGQRVDPGAVAEAPSRK